MYSLNLQAHEIKPKDKPQLTRGECEPYSVTEESSGRCEVMVLLTELIPHYAPYRADIAYGAHSGLVLGLEISVKD